MRFYIFFMTTISQIKKKYLMDGPVTIKGVYFSKSDGHWLRNAEFRERFKEENGLGAITINRLIKQKLYAPVTVTPNEAKSLFRTGTLIKKFKEDGIESSIRLDCF